MGNDRFNSIVTSLDCLIAPSDMNLIQANDIQTEQRPFFLELWIDIENNAQHKFD